MTDLNMTDEEMLAKLRKGLRKAEAQWNLGISAQIERRIQELETKIKNVCTAGILNEDGNYIGPCGKPWPCKDHNGYVG